MNIGFDLDKVFINYPPFIPDTLIDRFYKKKERGELVYRIPAYPEQILRKLSHTQLLRPPIKENLFLLQNLPKKDNKYYLISSRFKFLEKPTQRVIARYGLHKIFDEMFFNFNNEQPHLFKDRIIKKLNLDLYIDDDLSLLSYVAKKNKKTKFFWLNASMQKRFTPENIKSVAHLKEIFHK